MSLLERLQTRLEAVGNRVEVSDVLRRPSAVDPRLPRSGCYGRTVERPPRSLDASFVLVTQ